MYKYMLLWFPARIDDHTCLIYLQRWMDENDYRYLHRMQDVLNARFHSYDKREMCVEIVDKTLRLKKKRVHHYGVHKYESQGHVWTYAN